MITPGQILQRFSTFTIMYVISTETWDLSMNTDGMKVMNFSASSPESVIKVAYQTIQDELYRHVYIVEHAKMYPDEKRTT